MDTIKNTIIILALTMAYVYASNMDYEDAVMAQQAQSK